MVLEESSLHFGLKFMLLFFGNTVSEAHVFVHGKTLLAHQIDKDAVDRFIIGVVNRK